MLAVPRPLWLPVLNMFLVCITFVALLPPFQNALADGSPISSVDGDDDDAPIQDGKQSWSSVRALDERSVDESSSLPDKKEWKMGAWGKRDTTLPYKKWKMGAWGKRGPPFPKKKWKMGAWGKRDNTFADKKWKMGAWGKRDNIFPDKKWKMGAWGKRENPFADKKWKMGAWGKRDVTVPDKKWKMGAWGKRDEGSLEKKWRSSAWGKRDLSDIENSGDWIPLSVVSRDDAETPEKRWRASAWGKRDAMTGGTAEQDPGSIVPFGKESMVKSLDNINSIPTSSLNTNSAWSRYIDQFENEYIPVDPSKAKRTWDVPSDWGKRPSWSRNSVRSWGKRATDVIDMDKLKAALLRLKPAFNSMSAYD